MRYGKERYQLCPEPALALIRVAATSCGIRIEHQPGQRGRPPRPFHKILNSIWFQRRTGCQWKAIPETEYLCNGSTAHRWYKKLTDLGIFDLANCAAVALYLDEGPQKVKSLGVDCTISAGSRGQERTGPNPPYGGKREVKVSIEVDEEGRPVGIYASPAAIRKLKRLRPTLEKLAGKAVQNASRKAVPVASSG